jgi:hypothetical protein
LRNGSAGRAQQKRTYLQQGTVKSNVSTKQCVAGVRKSRPTAAHHFVNVAIVRKARTKIPLIIGLPNVLLRQCVILVNISYTEEWVNLQFVLRVRTSSIKMNLVIVQNANPSPLVTVGTGTNSEAPIKLLFVFCVKSELTKTTSTIDSRLVFCSLLAMLELNMRKRLTAEINEHASIVVSDDFGSNKRIG